MISISVSPRPGKLNVRIICRPLRHRRSLSRDVSHPTAIQQEPLAAQKIEPQSVNIGTALWSNRDVGLMAESAYAVVSKTIGSNPVWVQVPLKPPHRSSPLLSPRTNAKASQGDQSGPRLILVKKSRNLHIFLHSSQIIASNRLKIRLLLADAADSKSAFLNSNLQ